MAPFLFWILPVIGKGNETEDIHHPAMLSADDVLPVARQFLVPIFTDVCETSLLIMGVFKMLLSRPLIQWTTQLQYSAFS